MGEGIVPIGCRVVAHQCMRLLALMLLAVPLCVGLAEAQAGKVLGNEPFCTRAGPRVALVVTNTLYSGVFAPLTATKKDSDNLASALCMRDFTVWRVQDAPLDEMKTAHKEFAVHLKAAGDGAVGLYYFSGHGAVAEKRGDNYLIPAYAQAKKRADLPRVSVSLTALRDDLTAAADTAEALIIVLDACRNLAFPSDDKAEQKGLTSVPTKPGQLVVYATPEGTTALADNVFSRVLGETLQTSDEDITNMMLTVQERVFTFNGQQPWLDIGLRQRLHLPRNGVMPDKTRVAGAVDAEGMYWQGCCALAPDEPVSRPWLQGYIDRVKSDQGGSFTGRFRAEAERRVAAIDAKIKPVNPCDGKKDAALLECLAAAFLRHGDRGELQEAWAMIDPPNRQKLTFGTMAQLLQEQTTRYGSVVSRTCLRQPSPLPTMSAAGTKIFTVTCYTERQLSKMNETVSLEEQPGGEWRVLNFSAFPKL